MRFFFFFFSFSLSQTDYTAHYAKLFQESAPCAAEPANEKPLLTALLE